MFVTLFVCSPSQQQLYCWHTSYLYGIPTNFANIVRDVSFSVLEGYSSDMLDYIAMFAVLDFTVQGGKR